MVFLYSFASNRNQKRTIKEVKVSFAVTEQNLFITHEMVNNLLKQKFGGTLNIKKDKVALGTLETVLDDHEMIEKAQVFSTIDGLLSAQIKQKSPIVRFVSDDASYYLDYKGDKMPLSDNFSARVPLLSGVYAEKDKEKYVFLLNEIYNDSFLQKNITSVKIVPSGSVVLTARNYTYKIVFGKPVNVQKKLNNYKAFYQLAVKDTLINSYTEVNLKFTQQVVCKK
jgi:cell division protein FtsQ